MKPLPSPSHTTPLQLERFLPYRISVVSERVSGAIARLYEERFDLTIPEWRVMAVLGRHGSLTATEVGGQTQMDKVRVSRAIARLLEAGRIARTTQAEDRRRASLTLTGAGQAIYDEIAPLALSVEQEILAHMAPDDAAALHGLLDRLGSAIDNWQTARSQSS